MKASTKIAWAVFGVCAVLGMALPKEPPKPQAMDEGQRAGLLVDVIRPHNEDVRQCERTRSERIALGMTGDCGSEWGASETGCADSDGVMHCPPFVVTFKASGGCKYGRYASPGSGEIACWRP